MRRAGRNMLKSPQLMSFQGSRLCRLIQYDDFTMKMSSGVTLKRLRTSLPVGSFRLPLGLFQRDAKQPGGAQSPDQ